VEGSYEHSNKPSGSIKFWEIPNSSTPYRPLLSDFLQPRLHILRDVLFTDKAEFIRDGITNTRPCHSSSG
jgi:hypothetical protein